MEYSDIMNLISNNLFPIAISFYLLTTQNKSIKELKDVVQSNTEVVKSNTELMKVFYAKKEVD